MTQLKTQILLIHDSQVKSEVPDLCWVFSRDLEYGGQLGWETQPYFSSSLRSEGAGRQ